MARMPKQKPGLSKQDYGTPPELLAAVKHRLNIKDFDIDLAASAENAVTKNYFDEEYDSLKETVSWKTHNMGWNWLNPPYANIAPWVEKALEQAENEGVNTVVLIPASVGANWWASYVDDYCYQVFLNGRLTFVGETKPYPKDCALLLYTAWGFKGNEVWDWRRDVPYVLKQQSGKDKGVHQVPDVSLETGL